MAQLLVNNAATTLSVAALAGDATLTVADGSHFPTPTAGDYFLVTLADATPETKWEICKCTSRSGNVLTVTRAQEGTTALGWAIGSKCEARYTAATQIEASSIYDTPAFTGAVRRSQHAINGDFLNAVALGLSTSGSASANKAVLDQAISDASALGKKLRIPAGTYDSNALSDIINDIIIEGEGTGSILRFNTTSTCININPDGTHNQQRNSYVFRKLTFRNLTNVPAAFIANSSAANVLIEDCFFNDSSSTYCVDQRSGYGITMRRCVFSDITGTAVRLRDNNASPYYSYVAKLENCDISRMSVDGIEIEGTGVGPVILNGCVIEGNGGGGVRCNTKGGGGFTWNLILNGCYFEANTGFDISLNPNGSGVQSYAILDACTFVSTPTIDLGNNGRIQINSCANSGGHICVISGSANAQVYLNNSINFSQSGTFVWIDSSSDTDSGTYTPTWGSSGTAPSLGNGTITGKYRRRGNQVTIAVRLVLGSTSTMGTGNWYFTLPFTATETGQSGLVHCADSGNADWSAWCRTTSGSNAVSVSMTSGGTTNNANSSPGPTVPFTWGTSDFLELNLTYWV